MGESGQLGCGSIGSGQKILTHFAMSKHEQQFPHFVYKIRLIQSTGIFLFHMLDIVGMEYLRTLQRKYSFSEGFSRTNEFSKLKTPRLLEEATDWFNQCCTLSMSNIHIVRTTDSRFTKLCSYPNDFFQGISQ